MKVIRTIINLLVYLLEKIVPSIGTLLLIRANTLLFIRNKDVIRLEWVWIIITSIVLLLLLYFNIRNLGLPKRRSHRKIANPRFFVFINLAFIAIMVLSFYEMVLTEYFAPVGSYEDIFFTLLAGMLCYLVKLLIESIKLFTHNTKLQYLKEFYILLLAFYLVHGLWIVTQPDYKHIKLKNRVSVASALNKNLSHSQDFLGHKAFVLGSTEATYGYLIYEPKEVKSNNQLPLFIFLHGGDETGDSKKQNNILTRALKHGPSRYIKNGHWNPPTPMIVVSPQTTDGWWRPEMVHEFIEYLTANYSVDKSRIYLTGLSRGGTGSFDYVNKFGSDAYIAAMVPLATDAFVVHSGDFNPENYSDIPVWLFINDKDKYVADYKATTQIIQAIRNYNPNSKVTVFPKHGHDAWTPVYTMNGQGMEKPEYDPFDMNVFEWLLQFQKEIEP